MLTYEKRLEQIRQHVDVADLDALVRTATIDNPIIVRPTELTPMRDLYLSLKCEHLGIFTN